MRFFEGYGGSSGGIDAAAGAVTLSGENAAHIVKTLRLKAGDCVTVCDGAGIDYDCVISAVGGGPYVKAAITGSRPNENEPPYEATLFQAIPKGDKFGDIVRMCVELGVYEIYPLLTERGVAKSARVGRLSSISEAAAKQCGRGIIPRVHGAVDIRGCAEAAEGFDLRVCPWEEETGGSIKSAFKGIKWGERRERPVKVAVVIGSEGGLTEGEVHALKESGFIAVTLGKRVLRTQTAGAAALSMLLYESELYESEL